MGKDPNPICNVFIFYAKLGSGHTSAALALEAAFNTQHTGCCVTLIDVGEYSSYPVSDFPKVYRFLTRHPKLWATVFHTSNRQDFTRMVSPFIKPGLKRALTQQKGDIFISVMPGINGMLAELVDILHIVVTDLRAHKSWLQPRVRTNMRFFVPNEQGEADLEKWGVKKHAIEIVGIPVHPKFASYTMNANIRKLAYAKYGLDSQKTTLVAFVGSSRTSRKHLAAIFKDKRLSGAQMIIVTGRNVHQAEKLETHKALFPIKMVGFVEDMPELLSLADVVITKAGAMTLTESLVMGKPTVIIDPLPGQEVANAKYLHETAGVAMYAKNKEDFINTVIVLATMPETREALGKRAKAFAKPHAASDIVQKILSEKTPV